MTNRVWSPLKQDLSWKERQNEIVRSFLSWIENGCVRNASLFDLPGTMIRYGIKAERACEQRMLKNQYNRGSQVDLLKALKKLEKSWRINRKREIEWQGIKQLKRDKYSKP